jgi:hypothetical protein
VSQKFRARIAALIAELEKRTQGDNSGVVCIGREPTEEEVATARLRGRPILRVRFVSPEEKGL